MRVSIACSADRMHCNPGEADTGAEASSLAFRIVPAANLNGSRTAAEAVVGM